MLTRIPTSGTLLHDGRLDRRDPTLFLEMNGRTYTYYIDSKVISTSCNISFNPDTCRTEVHVYGESVSLRVKSHPDDAPIIARLFNPY